MVPGFKLESYHTNDQDTVLVRGWLLDLFTWLSPSSRLFFYHHELQNILLGLKSRDYIRNCKLKLLRDLSNFRHDVASKVSYRVSKLGAQLAYVVHRAAKLCSFQMTLAGSSSKMSVAAPFPNPRLFCAMDTTLMNLKALVAATYDLSSWHHILDMSRILV